MATLKPNYTIQKRNILNEIRPQNMSLQELRFFCIYLSKVHKDKPDETRVVRFPLDDFRAIMELEQGKYGRIDVGYMKNATNSLLCKVVNVADEHGGYTGFQLFKKCRVSKDENGEWFMEIDAHDDALPLMFEFKNQYFSYKLFNALRLRSVNQIRMYEVLKQYEKIGERIVSIEYLRDWLGIEKDEYPRYNNFKQWVLDPCKKALAEHTDIKFTYEPIRGKGKGGKIQSIRFFIKENKDYIDQLTLDMYIEQNKLNIIEVEVEDGDEAAPDGEYPINTKYNERIEFFMGACNNEFSFAQVEEINNILKENASVSYMNQMDCYDYIHRRYKKMDLQDKQTKGTDKHVKTRFGLLKYFLRKEVEL